MPVEMLANEHRSADPGNRREEVYEDGAKASSAMISIIESPKANGLEPYAYLKNVIDHIAAAETYEALDPLLPWNMK